MVILCNIAKWNKDNMLLLAETINPKAKIKLTSSFRRYDNLNIIDGFYENMNNEIYIISEEDDEIILRCRILRLLDKKKSNNIVSAMRASIVKELSLNSVDLIITEIVDQYFHDILVREAKKLNILVLAPIQTFVNGYSRLTLYGENQILRVPCEKEVNAVCQMLDDQSYEPNYVTDLKVSNFRQHVKRVSENMLRYIYFKIKLLNPKDKYDYHYLASSKGIRRYNSIFKIKSFKGNENWENQLSRSSKTKIYLPLQFYPEATIDYWCSDITVINFEDFLVKFIKKLSLKYQIILKEHPAALGFRNASFINEVNNLIDEDILFVPSNTPSNLILEKVDAVAVWTGSVGFEAAYRNKAVFILGEPYYVSGRFFKKVNLNTDINVFDRFIKDCQDKPMNKQEQNELVKNLVSGLIPGFFRNNGSYDNNNMEHQSEITLLASNINKYFLR